MRQVGLIPCFRVRKGGIPPCTG